MHQHENSGSNKKRSRFSLKLKDTWNSLRCIFRLALLLLVLLFQKLYFRYILSVCWPEIILCLCAQLENYSFARSLARSILNFGKIQFRNIQSFLLTKILVFLSLFYFIVRLAQWMLVLLVWIDAAAAAVVNFVGSDELATRELNNRPTTIKIRSPYISLHQNAQHPRRNRSGGI